jgi:hypothetical protein
MKRVYCAPCGRMEYRQADHPEFTAPRRETAKDAAVAFIAWGVVLAAYFLAMAWLVA